MQWSEHIDAYLNQRKMLKLILLLVDSRRELSQEDLEIAKWASYHQKPLLLILTKSDTLKPHDKQKASDKALAALPMIPLLYYSIKDGQSRSALIAKINDLLEAK